LVDLGIPVKDFQSECKNGGIYLESDWLSRIS